MPHPATAEDGAHRRHPQEIAASGQGTLPTAPSSAEDLADLAEVRVVPISPAAAAHLAGDSVGARRDYARDPIAFLCFM
jgi:hypothetical protein